ncbi:ArsR/SmtB family transcription factor [Spirillospora sp. CA-142024]|uniref:ArsR/SmtB family transcription factor n=1 Tax=Spirillospora sp. CA-142024 TaxID=3240036 RepID=UPI003D92DA53
MRHLVQQNLQLFASGAELAVGAVAEQLEIGQPNASQQPALVRRGGLLTSRRYGKHVRYRVNVAAVHASLGELQTYLRTCCPPGADAGSSGTLS